MALLEEQTKWKETTTFLEKKCAEKINDKQKLGARFNEEYLKHNADLKELKQVYLEDLAANETGFRDMMGNMDMVHAEQLEDKQFQIMDLMEDNKQLSTDLAVERTKNTHLKIELDARNSSYQDMLRILNNLTSKQ